MATGTFHTRVAGVTANNEDGMSRQKLIAAVCRVGMTVALVREPNNEHDKNAVAVRVEGRALIFFSVTGRIGYLPREIAWEVAEHLDRGGGISARVVEITGGTSGKPTRGVVLEVKKL